MYLKIFNTSEYGGPAADIPATLPYGDRYFADDTKELFLYDYEGVPVKVGGAAISGVGNIEQVLTVGSVAATQSLQLVSGKLTIGASSPFGSNLSNSLGSVTTSGNTFPFYNAVNKANAANNADLVYGISNLTEHDGAGNISQLRGIYNRARTDSTGAPSEIIGLYNEASYRNRGIETVALLGAAENLVDFTDVAGTGEISFAYGTRSNVSLNNDSATIIDVYGSISKLAMTKGDMAFYTGLMLEVDQGPVGNSSWGSGSYLWVKAGYDLTQGRANGIKVIDSDVDLPSTFAGEVMAKYLETSASPVYADEAAALAGGLTSGVFYSTPTGELRIKL